MRFALAISLATTPLFLASPAAADGLQPVETAATTTIISLQGDLLTTATTITTAESTVTVVSQTITDAATVVSTLIPTTAVQEALTAATSALTTATTTITDAKTALQTAQDKVAIAIEAQISSDAADTTLSSAQTSLATATTNLANITAEVGVAQLTVTTDIQNVTAAQEAITAAQQAGLSYTAYKDTGYNNAPPLGAGYVAGTGTVSSINQYWGGGSVMNVGADDVQVHYVGYITSPVTTNALFYGPADDGFILALAGTTIISDWYDKGGGGSIGQYAVTANEPIALDAWYYENGGGAAVTLYWDIGAGLVPVPSSAYSRGSTDPILQTNLDNATTQLAADQLILDNLEAIRVGAILVVQDLTAVKDAAQTSATAANNTALQTFTDAVTAVTNASAITQDVVDATTTAVTRSVTVVAVVNQEQQRQAYVPPAPQPEPQPQPQPEPTVDPTEEPAPTPEPTPTTTTEPSTEPEEPVVTPEEPAAPLPEEPVVVVEEEKPIEEPKALTSAKDIPEVISAELLTKIDLAEIVATDLSPQQAEALKEAALETFLTAEAGSPAYEQALDALFVAAAADDIVISAELAAIPGAAALVDALNFMSNVGADMSPEQREEAEKTVVAAVVAGNAAISAAAGAAGAASSAAGSSGGGGGASGGSRKESNNPTRKSK